MNTLEITITGFHSTLTETFRYWLHSHFPSLERVETICLDSDAMPQVGETGLLIHLLFELEDVYRSSGILRLYGEGRILAVYHDALKEKAPRLGVPSVSFTYCIDYLKGILFSSEESDEEKQVCFTPREGEILDLFARGMSVKEVAYELNISRYTVAAHQRNLYLKTDSHTLQQLTLFASLRGRGFPRNRPASRRGGRG